MRRITVWITAVVSVAALWLSNQANLSGATGKAGDERPGTAEHRERPGDAGDHLGKPGERK